MGKGTATSAEAVNIDIFTQLLDQYPTLIESLSNSKTGQKSLIELDEIRYEKAIEDFGRQTPRRTMNHEDVKSLVEWKLRHGKFRPTLMSLVTSNSADAVRKVVETAITAHRAGDTSAALRTLCELRGIGPATASLLLSVHDPKNVIFFSDEAYYWLCCDGEKQSIKYNPKEYEQLKTEAKRMQKRLGVSATAIEKVAYVVMKMPQNELNLLLSDSQSGKTLAQSAAPKQGQSESETVVKSVDAETSKHISRKSGAKRKTDQASAAVDDVEQPTRRSKRLRDQADS